MKKALHIAHKLFLRVGKRTLASSLVLALVMSLVPYIQIQAATLTPLTDTMSTQAKNVTATHTLAWTQGSGHAVTAGDTIIIDFANADFTLNAAGSWQTSDFSYTDSVRTNQAPVAVGASPSCSAGSNNYTVAIDATNNTFTITACSSWTAPSTGSAITFVINGTTASGTGTMTNANADTNNSIFTVTNTGSNTDSGSGAVVIETNDVVTVTATVNPTLTFSVGSASVALGTLTTSGAGTGQHQMDIATNGTGGFSITYNGATLTSGSDTIDAYGATATTPASGTEGFGINLKSNTSPAVSGSANPVTNAGATCNASTQYNTSNQYAFVASTTTTIATATGASDCTYHVSYLAEISTVTAAGSYSTNITYVATGTF